MHAISHKRREPSSVYAVPLVKRGELGNEDDGFNSLLSGNEESEIHRVKRVYTTPVLKPGELGNEDDGFNTLLSGTEEGDIHRAKRAAKIVGQQTVRTVLRIVPAEHKQ
ncbi:hypothetical protein AAVH_06549 [Aphelenchoides avenae]|nr:hypothetical protein AAVH_06549 [Aphelenchus avenae]